MTSLAYHILRSTIALALIMACVYFAFGYISFIVYLGSIFIMAAVRSRIQEERESYD